MLGLYLADLPSHGGEPVDATVVGLFAAIFYLSELVLSPIFGILSDRYGHHRIMLYGPIFGGIAGVLTGLTTSLPLLGATRLLEGASTAASVPSILGFIAMVTAGDELPRGRAAARLEGSPLAGIGAGAVAAGVLYDGIPGVWAGLGRDAFLLNAGIYVISLLIYRYGVSMPPAEDDAIESVHGGWRRYREILLSSHVWLLAPTWIAINAAL